MPNDSDQKQFEVLLERHRGIVSKVAGMYCRHAEDRRDLAQEISAQLWRSFARYDEKRPFATWMYRVALNVAISFARRASVREQHVTLLGESAPDPIDERGNVRNDDERVLALARFIAGLDALNKALLLLYLEEQSYREIAEVLGISETNVATKISRLKQRIQRDVR
jgi:RNA polymerase sigma-70 factor (ECF subfamily)